MKNLEEFMAMFTIGGTVVLLVTVGISTIQDNSYKNLYERNQQLIIECEKTLPRTETCILVAVPKQTK